MGLARAEHGRPRRVDGAATVMDAGAGHRGNTMRSEADPYSDRERHLGRSVRHNATVEWVKSVVAARLSEGYRPFLDLRSLIRAAGNNPEAELEGQPMTFLNANARQRVSVQVKALTVEQEGGDDGKPPDLEALTGVFGRALDAVTWPPLEGLRVDFLFIEPFDLPFHELVHQMRSQLLAPVDLYEGMTDVAVVVDRQDDERTTSHMHIGPMTPEQLNQQILAFRRTNVPRAFVFMALGRTLVPAEPLTTKSLKKLVNEIRSWASEQADHVCDVLRR